MQTKKIKFKTKDYKIIKKKKIATSSKVHAGVTILYRNKITYINKTEYSDLLGEI